MTEILPARSGKEIFKQSEFLLYVNMIKNLVSCPTEIYKPLYLAPLYSLAEYCQSIPYLPQEFNFKFGFLQRQLKLVVTALKIRRGILLPKNMGAESIASEEAQWTYAIFSSCLLKDLYQLQNNRKTLRYQLQGQCIGEWVPISGSLCRDSFFYTTYFSENPLTNIDEFMAAVSGHIIPEFATAWLATNSLLFKQWWEAILHQSSEDNDIENIIKLSVKKIKVTCDANI